MQYAFHDAWRCAAADDLDSEDGGSPKTLTGAEAGTTLTGKKA